ncbi:hypothetical protein D3C80_679190 [compost metagenome]
MLLENALGKLAVNLGAGQLFQQFGPIIGIGIQEGSELPLRQHHRFGKTTEIQSGDRSGKIQLVADFIGQDFAVIAQRQLHLRRLQVAVRGVFGTALAPERAVTDTFNLKLDLRQRLGGVAGHQLILAWRDIQARRLVVQCQTDSVQQGGFTRAGRAGDGK